MPTVFVITPFSPEAAGGEDPEVFEKVQRAIRDAASKAEFDFRRADDIFAGGIIIDQVRGAIEQADVVVAVCTGRNTNVFYELGLAEVMGHRPILVARSTEDLPFDVAHWRAQLYGEQHGLEDLAERIYRAIVDTHAERQTEPTITRPAAVPERPDNSPSEALEAVRKGDQIAFVEELKRRVADAGSRHAELAEENWGVAPGQETLDGFAALRYTAAESILEWMNPALEYPPEWLPRSLNSLAEAFAATVGPRGSSGYSNWRGVQQTWTYLALRSSLGIAARHGQPQSLRALLTAAYTGDGGDGSPLLLSSPFTWNSGYGGDSKVAFFDLVGFAGQSQTILSVCGSGMEPVDIVCGGDLLIGLARWLWEEANPEAPGLGWDRRPKAYAGFAHFECQRIAWMARRVETSTETAQALGAVDLATMQATARTAYPELRAKTTPTYAGMRTCSSWDEAIAWRG